MHHVRDVTRQGVAQRASIRRRDGTFELLRTPAQHSLDVRQVEAVPFLADHLADVLARDRRRVDAEPVAVGVVREAVAQPAVPGADHRWQAVQQRSQVGLQAMAIDGGFCPIWPADLAMTDHRSTAGTRRRRRVALTPAFVVGRMTRVLQGEQRLPPCQHLFQTPKSGGGQHVIRRRPPNDREVVDAVTVRQFGTAAIALGKVPPSLVHA